MEIPLWQVKYCWECFTFHDGRSSEFEKHCASHLSLLTSQHYKVMVYHHTTICAGYCIECMWDNNKSTACRMRAFVRSVDLRRHVEEHIDQKTWPSRCSDPLCGHVSSDEQGYRCHLHDVHHYNKTICVRAEKTNSKRPSSELDEKYVSDGSRQAQQKHPRKLRKTLSSPSPMKELKTKFWEPPANQKTMAMLSLPTMTKDENQECLKELACQTLNHCDDTHEAPCISQDGYITHSASSNTPELADVLSVCSSSSAISISPNTIPIDPQILEASADIMREPGHETEEPGEKSLRGQVESYYSIEQPEVAPPSRISHIGPVPEHNKPGGDAALETDGTLVCHTIPPPNSPSEDKELQLTSNELSAVAEWTPSIRSSFDMCISGSEIALASAGPLTRAKAKEQTVNVLRNRTISQKSTRKARPYNQEEDKLLKRLMEKGASFEKVAKAFQEEFPGRSGASLQR